MVKTRAEIKIKIKEFIDARKEPFKTSEAFELKTARINLYPQRLQNYIRRVSKAKFKFNKTSKRWEPINASEKPRSV